MSVKLLADHTRSQYSFNCTSPMENPKSLLEGSKRAIHGAVFDGLMSFMKQ